MNAIRASYRSLLIGGLCCALFALPASADEGPADAWQVTAGLGAGELPRFPGSNRHRYLALPILSVAYGPFFLGDSPGSATGGGLGFIAFQDVHWRLGLSVSQDFITPRRASDDPRLHGFADVDKTAHAVAFASYTLDWATLRASVSSDIAGHGEGTLASVDLEAYYRPLERLTLLAGPGATWASGPYMQTFFGVNAMQSAASGLPAYQVSSGLEAVRVSAGARYALSKAWVLGARASVSRLHRTAADSPITESRTQDNIALYCAYRF